MRRLLLVALVAWAAVALLVELRRGFESYDARETFVAGHPLIWRFGTTEVERLERCVARAAGRVKPGSRIAFLSPEGDADAAFFRWRWAAYFLPAYSVSPEVPDSPLGLPQAVIAYDRGFTDPRYVAVERRRGCRLYLQGELPGEGE